jgi:hypothetical protein
MMKKKLKFILIILVVSAISKSCSIDVLDDKLIIQNNTNDTIVYYYDIDSMMPLFPARYIDSFLYVDGKRTKIEANTVIHPYELKHVRWPGNWDYFFSNTHQRNVNLYLFIFSKSTLANVPWDTIRKKNLYLKKYKFSKKDLDELAWIIKFQ